MTPSCKWPINFVFTCKFIFLLNMINQEKIKECQSQRPQLQQINGDADVLLDSGRLDQGDAERVERINETLSTRFSTISAKLEEAQSK